MKIGELLLLRGETKKRVDALRARIVKNAKVQEGNAVHEKAEMLLEQALLANRELHRLVLSINEANLQTQLPDGRSLTAALARREELATEHSLLRAAVDAAVADVDRYSSREIRWVPTFDVASLQERADLAALELRKLNLLIQQANWQYDIPTAPG